MDIDVVLNRPEDLLMHEMDSEVLVMSVQTLETHHLSDHSLIIWNLCDGSRSIRDITELLVGAYPGQAKRISTDVVSTIEALVENQLLEDTG